VGIVASYTMEDWEQDIRQAMGVGIDGWVRLLVAQLTQNAHVKR